MAGAGELLQIVREREKDCQSKNDSSLTLDPA